MSACLLLVLFLSICDGGLAEKVKISTDENTTRPETTIPQGRVKGINMVTHHGRTFFGFLGIPYARPPIGDLRFKAPVPADPWNGTLDADNDAEPCPQYMKNVGVIGNENCLNLNVFTPQLPAKDNSAPLPVMVYVIGGGFRMGSNSIRRYGPDFLLDEDVVLVVPNFRVGLLGYFTTGDEASPGNYGLKDIVRALQWVQDNIQYFAGDPNRVTLFGGSSGAISIHLLALSNLTDGLFHKYITQSGTAFASSLNAPREVHVNKAIQLGKYLGCPTNTSILLVNCLRYFNTSELVDTRSVFYIWKTFPLNVWSPSIEPDIDGALLIDTPKNLLADGKIRDLPWISSVNRDDGFGAAAAAFYKDPDLLEDFLDNFDVALPTLVFTNVTAYIPALKSFYFNDLMANRNLLLSNLTDLLGDIHFFYPAYHTFQRQLGLAKSPQYFGSFEYRGILSYTYELMDGSTEYSQAAHGDEHIYLFETHDHQFGPADYERTEADWKMVDTMVQLWTSFATNGTPTTKDSVSTTTWEPYSSLNNYLRIGNGSDTSLEMKYNLNIERMRFWDELIAAMPFSGEF